MNTQTRIDQLKSDIAALQAQQAKCQHSWKQHTIIKYRKEGYGNKLDPSSKGSDPNWIYEGYTDVPYTVYIRTCDHCGLEQETTKAVERVVKTVTEPIF